MRGCRAKASAPRFTTFRSTASPTIAAATAACELPGADAFYRRCLSLPLYVGVGERGCAEPEMIEDTGRGSGVPAGMNRTDDGQAGGKRIADGSRARARPRQQADVGLGEERLWRRW